MKYILATLLFLVYSFLTISLSPPAFLNKMRVFNQSLDSAAKKAFYFDSLQTSDSSQNPYTGYQAVDKPAGESVCSFAINVKMDPQEKIIYIDQKTTWRNRTRFPTQEMYLHFYPNAYKDNYSIFAAGRAIPIESQTEMIIDRFQLSGGGSNIQFVNTDAANPRDYTVARVSLNRAVQPGDSVLIQCAYHYKVPKAYGRMGYSVNDNFFFFAQWFIKPGVFEEGKWICSPYFPYTEFYSDFADYKVTITAPDFLNIQATGTPQSSVRSNDGNIRTVFSAERVHDFAWAACAGYFVSSYDYKFNNGNKTRINIAVPESYRRYVSRYEFVLNNAFKYFEYNLGAYPYKCFTMILVPPKSGRVASMEYPQLITVSHPAFTSDQSLDVEKLIIHEFAHQYFYGIIANNETYEGWLDEGLANYMTSRMLDDYGLNDISRFRLFGYLPIQGLELLAMGEIPLIYTLTKITTPNQSISLDTYYRHLADAALADSSYLLNDPELYSAITYGKAEIYFKTLERLMGRDAFFGCLRRYYSQNKYRHVKMRDFAECVKRGQRKNFDWYFDNFYANSFVCDYSVEQVNYDPVRKECRIDIKKKEQAYFPSEIALYTVKDTLFKTVASDRRRFTVTFTGVSEPVGAEIDPQRKNYFDKEFANNSLLLSGNYEAPVYISTRWFFWMQSFLLIFGSIV